MENITNISKIDMVSFDKNLTLYFTTRTNMLPNDLLRVTIAGKFFFFKVTNVITESELQLGIIAQETGSKNLSKDKNLDLRDLLGIEIDLIKEQDIINNINQQATWC